MLKFAANLTTMFREVNFPERFCRASQAGFKAVEYMFPYDWSKEQLKGGLENYGLKQVLFNLPAGNWEAGERGIACLPGRETEFREGVYTAIDYAQALNCSRLNCLVGLVPQDKPEVEVRQTLVQNLGFAANALEKDGIRLLVEPLNCIDVPWFYLVSTRDALQLIAEVDHPNLWLQYDVYHMQIMEGNLTRTILDNLNRIGHIQIADVPGRHEPGTGEINYSNLFNSIEEAAYDGWIGCEYIPASVTEDGLDWIKPSLITRRAEFHGFTRG